MLPNHAPFLEAIHARLLVRVAYYSLPDTGVVDRVCIPLDYGPAENIPHAPNFYWLQDPAATDPAANPLRLLPDQIVSLAVLGSHFEPAALPPPARGWSVTRDWIHTPAGGVAPPLLPPTPPT